MTSVYLKLFKYIASLYVILSHLMSLTSAKNNICVATLGRTHMNVYNPIVQELIRRRHNVTIFVSTGNLLKTMNNVGPTSDHLRYISFKGAGDIPIPSEVHNILWNFSRAMDSLFSWVSFIIIYSAVRDHRRGITPEYIQLFRDSSCDVLLADVFQWQMIDLATQFDVPILVSLNQVYAGYPNAILPVPPPLYVGRSLRNMNLLETIAIQVSPFLDSMAMHIAGTLYYGYPRHMLSSVFARPYITPVGSNYITTHIPRSVFVLGPYNANIALLEDKDVSSSQVGLSIDVSTTLTHCSRARPLVVGAKRLLLAAFGTNVVIPIPAVSRLCEAFRIVLDSGAVDKVVFSRRVVDFQESDGDIQQCRALCHDDRIWSTTWINQEELLTSGAVGLFLSHGGFSSMLEATSARVPLVLLPAFGDQTENGYIASDSGIAELIQKIDSAEDMARTLIKVARNSILYLNNAKSSIINAGISAGLLASAVLGDGRNASRGLVQISSAEARGADLLELVAKGGVDNSLQQLVPKVWTHYANKDGPSFVSYTFMGATLYLLLGIVIMLSPLLLIIRMMKHIIIFTAIEQQSSNMKEEFYPSLRGASSYLSRVGSHQILKAYRELKLSIQNLQ